jgi:hypothetical protein
LMVSIDLERECMIKYQKISCGGYLKRKFSNKIHYR